MRRDGVTSSADTRHGEHRDSAPGLCELHRGGIGWGLGGVGRELGGGGGAVYEGVPAMLSYSGAAGHPHGFRVSISHTDLI